MAIRKIISRSIGVDVIAAEDLADGSVQTAEIQNGAVTGPKLADNLNYDSGTLYLDSTNNRVGIGITNPLAPLHVNDTASAFYVGYGGNQDIYLQTTNGNILFTDYNAANERMRIDSSGNVGINTSTPASLLEVKATALNRANGIALRGSGANDVLYLSLIHI